MDKELFKRATTLPKATKAGKPKPTIPSEERALYMQLKAGIYAGRHTDPRLINMSPKFPAFSSYSNFLEDLLHVWAKAKDPRHALCYAKIDVRGVMRNGTYTATKATKGIEDVQLLIHGTLVAVEVKAGKDVQSDAQKERQSALQASGAHYLIAKDGNIIEQLEKLYSNE